jgi:hypothetical protein
MTRFLCRLAVALAAASIPLVGVAIATSAVGSAACDPNWSRNVWTGECTPPPGPPDWYTPRPAYAPPYAPLDVPPPPPAPPWAQQMQPRWDEGGQHWVWSGI